MKNSIKRWASILVVFALFMQTLTPSVLAVEGDNANTDGDVSVTDVAETDANDDGTVDDPDDEKEADEEVDVVIEDVAADEAVDVLEDALDETDNADEVINDVVDEVLEEVDSQEDAEQVLDQVTADVEEEIEELESEKDPVKRLKNAKRILQLKAFLLKLRVKAIANHSNLAKAIKHVKEGRRLYQIRWGVLERTDRGERCPGLSKDEIRAALDAGETPNCDIARVDYDGSVEVNKGEMVVKKRVLFEKNDKLLGESGDSIDWTSHIAGHWDGLIIEYMPSDEEGEVEVTLSIGEVDATFTADELFGRKAIGNGHHVEVLPLARALDGVSDRVQDKLVENKLQIQERIDEVREKLRRLQLLRANAAGDVSSESDELEELLEEVEEYNFDDTSADEIEAEIEAVVNDLGDGANKEKLVERLKKLRTRLAAIRANAKARKFADKIIPFKDTDDSEWYTKYVAPMKDRGIISGYKDRTGAELGEYRPGNNVTVAEILKIGLETSNNGESEGNPRHRAALAHWAKNYVKRAEELKLDMVTAEDDVDLNRPATRGEVIRMMLEAAGVEPSEVNKTDFTDVLGNHVHADYIQYAKNLDIVSGDDWSTTFRPDEPINRAEVAKIANQILSVLLGE